MTFSKPPVFQIHWSLVSSDDAAGLVPPGGQLLAIWPAPVNHDVCFEAAGFTLFAENDEEWDKAAKDFLQRVINRLSSFGALKQINVPLRDDPPWYLRAFRTGHELPLLQQALFPMQWDNLPRFHAQFGGDRVALRTGDGHFLLWITMPDIGMAPVEFVRGVAASSEVHESPLRWNILLSGFIHDGSATG
jgi:hypothetical protein